ncbi:protein kinase [bacterium]|nr:protein kinase [bacterium]
MSSPPFEFLGPYRIGKPLGRGGMGTVFAAVHEKTKQPVAVKLISDNVADESKFRRRFDAEIKSLQCLSHSGIVRIYGFGEEEGHLFYSMELVRGDSLQKVIKREKRLEWQTTITQTRA